MSATCLKIEEEEGRTEGRNVLGVEQVACEGSEIGKLACLERTSALRIENFI